MFLTLSNYLTQPITWVVAVFGLMVGSFLNVCIFRIPEGTFFKNTRSVCRHCAAMVPSYLNIPVFSYLCLRGRTACCGRPLARQYFFVELATGVMFAVCYWRYPFLINYVGMRPELDLPNTLRFAHLIVFVSLLLVCSVIDLRLMIIPDVISIPMIIATPAVVYFHPDLKWQSAALGVVIGGGALYAVAWIYWIVRREIGLGFGDVKLLAAIGGWLGVESILPTILMASVSGSLLGLSIMTSRRSANLKIALPFGPFLAFGAVAHLFFNLQDWLARTF